MGTTRKCRHVLHVGGSTSEEMHLGDEAFAIAQLAFALGKGMNEKPDEHQREER